MLYLVVATTRSHCDLADADTAGAFQASFARLRELQDKGVVKFAGLSGPFTPMKTFVLLEAANHEEAYAFITGLPAWTYMDNALFPVISLEVAERSVKALMA